MADDPSDQPSQSPAALSKRKWSCPTLAVEQVIRTAQGKTVHLAETHFPGPSTIGPAS